MLDETLIPEDHVIVVFGATGDLARRKLLPALYHLAEEGWLPRNYRIIASSGVDMSQEEFKDFARAAVDEFSRSRSVDDCWEQFSANLMYAAGEFVPGETQALKEAVSNAEGQLGDRPSRLFYLAVPPVAFVPITEALGHSGLSESAKVIFEKPFGHDLESFEHLNRSIHEILDESQIYRIDHYLGKETVQNILAFRFANGMVEPVWQRQHIEHVQIDVPEAIGIGSRAGFYDHIGALRDMVVTHLFQVLSFIALEPPSELNRNAIAEEKLKVFDSMVALDPAGVVRGQYEGYREEKGVAEGSDTETFFAGCAFIDNWRWTGVPFYLRTGKCLPEKRSTVTLAFRDPPSRMFAGVDADGLGADHLTIELGPNEGISMQFLTRVQGPGIRPGKARMSFRYEASFGSELIEAYERLLHDAMIGDQLLFTSGVDIGRAWELVGPVLADPPPLHPYAKGSWGPPEADDLVGAGTWNAPGEARVT